MAHNCRTRRPRSRPKSAVSTPSFPSLGLSRQRRRQLLSVGGNLMSFDLLSLLWKERDASVIHTHTLGRLGGIARLVAKLRHIPFVVSIDGGLLDLPRKIREEFNAPVRGGLDWGKLFGCLLGSRRLLRDADCIITCNETEAGLLRKKYPTKRIYVQPSSRPLRFISRTIAKRQGRVSQIIGRQVLAGAWGGLIRSRIKPGCWPGPGNLSKASAGHPRAGRSLHR